MAAGRLSRSTAAALAGRGCDLVELPGQRGLRHAHAAGLFPMGHWRQTRMLPVDPDEMAIPSEVPGQVPLPVADAGVRVREG